jgi:hypothetical protein
MLLSCSTGSIPEFTTEGVIEPAGSCDRVPTEFAEARSLGTVGNGACVVRNGWELSSVGGVELSQPATVTCQVAGRFGRWLDEVVQPAAREHYGRRVTGVQIAASYACRPRNSRSGAKLSEHGFGNAIDVAAFTLADGRVISVERDHRGDFFREVRRQACGIFHTVLGPGSDRHHDDHLHLDLANRKSGQTYCQ